MQVGINRFAEAFLTDVKKVREKDLKPDDNTSKKDAEIKDK
jgi:hypothetical protein